MPLGDPRLHSSVIDRWSLKKLLESVEIPKGSLKVAAGRG